MCKKILVTLDGSKTSEAILPVVAALAPAGADITLLNVEPMPEAVGPAPRPLVVAGAPAPGGVVTLPLQKPYETRDQAISAITDRETRYLEEAAKPLIAKGIHVKTQVAFGDAAVSIIAYAQHEDVDVIMMATHGRSALAEMLFGSVASAVLRAGVKPVMVVRPNGLK
jgi:nucleotide-binding universal stress UspA family protein